MSKVDDLSAKLAQVMSATTRADKAAAEAEKAVAELQKVRERSSYDNPTSRLG
jgi:hypothetical protein